MSEVLSDCRLLKFLGHGVGEIVHEQETPARWDPSVQ